jgi:hypothetical protein
MSEEETFTLPKFFAGYIGAIVENKPLDESLREVGLSEAYVLGQWVAPQSSDVATDYVREVMAEQFGKISRDEGSGLYLVKKVLCGADDYEAMAEAVSVEDTDKFQVLSLIGSNPLILRYKQENPGLEAYLVSGRNPMEAMRKTTADDPIFNYSATTFDADDAKEFDGLVTNAVYKHSFVSFF